MMTWRAKLGLAKSSVTIYNDKVKAGRRLKVCGQYTDVELAYMKTRLEAAGETVLEAKQHAYKHLGIIEMRSVVLVVSN